MEKSLRKEIGKVKANAGLMRIVDCTQEENSKFLEMKKASQDLPEDVFRKYENEKPTSIFYRYEPTELIDDTTYLTCKQVELLENQTTLLKSIKGMLIFFVALTVISLVGGLIIMLG